MASRLCRLSAVDADHKTPREAAARNRQVEMIHLLLAKGAKVNVCDKDGRTPLMFAAFGHSEAVRALIQAGADVQVKGSEEMTALHWAATEGDRECVRELLARL
jgi:ankyrin repeat protein